MITKWTDHIQDQEQKENFRREIYGAKRVLNRLSQILAEEEVGLQEKEISVKAFETPNWPFLQAYQNGYTKALRVTQKILDLDNSKGN